MSKLQWGRRMNAAEREYVELDIQRDDELQWGRRMNAAESVLTYDVTIGASSELQWGRRMNAAESGA